MKRLGILAFSVLADARKAMEERTRSISASAVAAGREAERNEGGSHLRNSQRTNALKTKTAINPKRSGQLIATSAEHSQRPQR